MAQSTAHAELLEDVRHELSRVGADNVKVRIDEKFAPDVGPLMHIQHGSAYWHMLPEHFLTLLKPLKSQAGSDAVQVAIEKRATHVWHGPEPEGSRDSASPS